MKFRGCRVTEVPEAELAAELAVEPIWNDVWEQQLIAQAVRIVRQEYADSTTFKAFEQYVLLDRSAEVVAAELQINVNNVHQAKSRVTKRCGKSSNCCARKREIKASRGRHSARQLD